MTDPLDHFAEAVSALHDPRARAVDRLAEAVNGTFAEAARRPGANPELHLRLADTTARHRELRARVEAKYGPVEGMLDRMQARGGGLSARVWC